MKRTAICAGAMFAVGMMTARAGAFVGAMTKYPILIGLIAALGAIPATVVLAVDKQKQGENDVAGNARS